MSSQNFVSRRKLLNRSLAIGGLLIAAPLCSVLAGITPSQGKGPFYPVKKPLDQDADLTVIAGSSKQAEGRVVYLMGRVLNNNGEPIEGAHVEVWQANAYGRYSHPYDSSSAKLDPNFEGFSAQLTDSRGRYRLKTIKPGAYQVSGNWTRPPHIHFSVRGRSRQLITQMYFENEPLNEFDRLLHSASDPQSLIAKYQTPTADMEADALSASWDIMLLES